MMKRFTVHGSRFKVGLMAAVISLAITAQVSMAASSITPTLYSISKDQSQLVIKLACVADTDGTFTSQQITNAALFPSGSVLPVGYQLMGYYVYEVWAVNPGSSYATVAAAVTMVDEAGNQLIKSGELALSTSASAVVEASLAKFRALNSLPTISIADTGTAANTVDIYIKLVR